MLTAGFETGVNGNTLSTGDAGDASAWSNVTIGTGATLVYDSTRAAFGTLSMKATTTGTAASARAGWFGVGNLTDHYGRFYLYLTANPGANVALVRAETSGAAVDCSLVITTAGKVATFDSAGASQGVSTTSLTLNQWVRVEYRMIHNAATGSMQVLIFNSPHSSTPTETLNSNPNINTGASCDRLYFGIVGVANIGPLWIDNVVAQVPAYPGPVATLSQPGLRTTVSPYR